MPELPEVETVCWRLREGGHGEPAAVGRRITGVTVTDPRVLTSGDASALFGRTLVDVRRRAKWIILATDADVYALVHLRMTGDLHAVPAGSDRRFARLTLHLGDLDLVFSDPRRFGTVDVVDGGGRDAALADLGPEPLDQTFTARALRARLTGRRAIKATLLDQSVVAGVGNIYADEACFRARLHPSTSCDALSDDDVIRLHHGLRRALTLSIAQSKEALAWRYENRAAPSPFLVYDRAGEACVHCGNTLTSSTIAGRTTVSCPTCQPEP